MDATRLVRTYYDYDALGKLIRTDTANEVKYQFTRQEYDEDELHNYRARLYDSDLGKFYAPDPAGGLRPFNCEKFLARNTLSTILSLDANKDKPRATRQSSSAPAEIAGAGA